MNRSSFLYVFLGLALLLSNSCTIKKRSYQKGYYVDWAIAKHHKKETIDQKTKKTDIQTEAVLVLNKNDKQEVLIVNSNPNNLEQLAKGKRIAINSKDTCGDVITLKNADQIRAKVLEINDETIQYKRCDNFDGPIYTVGKEKVSHITYANGYKEMIEPPVRKFQPVQNNQEKEYPSELIFACVFPFVLSIIGVGLSIYFANKSKKKILNNPNKYKGLALSKYVLFFNYSLIIAAIVLIIAVALWSYEFILIALLAWLVANVAAIIHFYRSK